MISTANKGPRVNLLLHAIGRLVMWAIGWRIEGEEPDLAKYVVIVAPHTTNWDLPLFLFASFVVRIKGNWLGKHTIFWWPLGWLLRAFGGIPLNRTSSRNLVQQVVDEFNARERMILGLAPEGTRSKMPYWRSGFYHIALQAKVPIVLIFADYGRKVCGWGPIIHPTGDISADMDRIRDFCGKITPCRPDRVGPMRLREEDERARDPGTRSESESISR